MVPVEADVQPAVAAAVPGCEERGMPQDMDSQLTALLRRLPDWMRRDIAATDPARRERAEEALHAMLLALIQGTAGSVSGQDG